MPSPLLLRGSALFAATISALLCTVPPAWADDDVTPDQVVETLEKISGVHPGLRRNHAKGICATGSFQGNSAGQSLSLSALFSGQSIPVIARFSLAGPNPKVPDATRNPRGLALQFQLPNGELHQMAMLNTPVFGASTVQSFYERQQADVPDPATGKRDPEKLKSYKAAHPDNAGQADWLNSHNPPPSFAEAAYYSLNAFKFTNAAKQDHWIKWRFVPHDGDNALSDTELQSLPADFLATRLEARTRKAPVAWDMIVTLGQPDDPIDNPSVAWPTDRKEVKVGVLTLTKAGSDAAGQCEDINFDPNLLSNGVEASPDAILQFRSGAYAVSYGKRIQEKP